MNQEILIPNFNTVPCIDLKLKKFANKETDIQTNKQPVTLTNLQPQTIRVGVGWRGW